VTDEILRRGAALAVSGGLLARRIAPEPITIITWSTTRALLPSGYAESAVPGQRFSRTCWRGQFEIVSSSPNATRHPSNNLANGSRRGPDQKGAVTPCRRRELPHYPRRLA